MKNFLISALLIVVLVGSTRAAPVTWNATSTDFNAASSWAGGTAPGSGDNAWFVGAFSSNQPGLTASTTIQGLTFNGTGASGYTLSAGAGSSLTLTNTSTGANSAILADNTSGNNTISAPIILGGANGTMATFTQAAGGGLGILGNISSTNAISGLNLAGGNGRVFTLSGSNTYAGNTTTGSSAGITLNLNSATALSSGALEAAVTLTIDNTSGAAVTLTNNNNIQLAGGSLTFLGTRDLSFGSGTVTAGTANRTLTVNGGTLAIGSINTDTTHRSVTKAGNGTLVIANAAGANFQGRFLSGCGSVVVGNKTSLGSGQLAVSGVSTLEASTDLSGANALANEVHVARNFTLGGSHDLELSGNVTMNGSRTLTVDNTGHTEISGSLALSDTATGRTLTIAGSQALTISGAISNGNGTTGNLVINNSSGVTLTNANNSYTGTTMVSAGTLLIQGAHSGTGAVTVESGAAIGGGGSIAGNLILDAGANFVFSLTDTLTVNGISVSFGGFGISNVLGLDGSVAVGTYTLINGSATFDFANVSNWGAGNAANIGGGKQAYFQEGSLEVVVIPEPGLAGLLLLAGSLGVALGNWRRPRNRQDSR